VIRTGLEYDSGISRGTDARDAALLRALLDAARIRGQVVLVDRYHDGCIVCVGGERQTSEGRDMREAIAVACTRIGLDPEPPAQTIRAPETGSTEEGGP
jgi:hypothetical protein